MTRLRLNWEHFRFGQLQFSRLRCPLRLSDTCRLPPAIRPASAATSADPQAATSPRVSARSQSEGASEPLDLLRGMALLSLPCCRAAVAMPSHPLRPLVARSLALLGLSPCRPGCRAVLEPAPVLHRPLRYDDPGLVPCECDPPVDHDERVLQDLIALWRNRRGRRRTSSEGG